MAGYQVSRSVLDSKAAQAVLNLRGSFREVENIAGWLANNPVVEGDDPLVTVYEYTEDEAYILRIFFESMNNVRISNASIFEIGRKLTGLE